MSAKASAPAGWADNGHLPQPDADLMHATVPIQRLSAEHARNRATPRLFRHCLAENSAMIWIARRAGMQVTIDSGDADAHVALPPPTPRSLLSEMLADRVATSDFALRSGVETWRRIGVALVAIGRP